MDIKKLDKWAELLLDTGKRNNLINFKDTKATTVEVLLPSSEALFEKIDRMTSLEVFDPKNIEEDEIEESVDSEQLTLETPDETSVSNGKTAFLTEYSGKIKRQNQVLLYNTAANPLVAVKNIDKKAREFTEETGVNVAYMAFGFIHWKENGSSNLVFRAPILLVPIQLEQASVVEPYYIKSTGDDVIVNPTFAYKMDAEYGVKMPEYSDEGLSAYLEIIKRLVAKLQWTVSSECKIGIFSFLKINMYRDLKDNASAILSNQNVRQLLGEPIETSAMSGDSEIRTSAADPLIELHSVVDADSSQIEAIEMAKSGKSFVLQGPPGTGKSQTISNIIAECLSDGKKVLFVSEKLAALNVVYDKLKQAGLSEFCLELHSHKANKKDIIADICHTLRTEKSAVSPKADAEIAIKEKAKRQLDSYAVELHKQRPMLGKSLYQLYESYAAFRSTPDVEWAIPELKSKGESYLIETASLLEQYVDFIPSVGYDYRKNPWYGYINQDTSYQAKSEVKNNFSSAAQLLQALIPLQKELSEKYGINCISVDDAHRWEEFLGFAAASDIVTPSLLRKEHFDAVNASINELQALSSDILASLASLSSVFDDDIYKIDGAAFHKKLTQQFSGIFSRLFNSEYSQLVTDLRMCKKDGKKPSYNEAVTTTERLADYQQKTAEYAEAEASAKMFLGTAYKGVETDWAYVAEQMAILKNVFSAGVTFGTLADGSDFSAERDTFANYAERFEKIFETGGKDVLQFVAGCFDSGCVNVARDSCTLVLDRLNDCLREMDKLDNWCHFRNLLSKLSDKQAVSYLNNVINRNTEPKFIAGAFKKQFYYQWIDSIISESPALSAFNRISQDKAIHTFSEKDTEQFEINKAKIRAELSAKRPSLDMIASGSALAILLREGEKKRKQKSIRTLLTETGELIQRIKPCFLMSPLSVSTFLTPESVHFDVVIFDEASQIFPQDAIGAIYRGNQLIVVGDSKQMPPSNFFNASTDAESNDEETGDVTDFESILDLCSTSMQQLRLRWHYRSRYEQLISFSNKNFYDNDLVTFPSSKADASGVGIDYYHVDGVFDRKSHTNRKEAETVVDLIYQNIEKYPNRTLGVVAFSVAQQDLIEKLLAKRRQSTPEKEYFFKNEGQEPFFIKNLETVQGDERDTIIFSIAYGMDEQGRLLHNFGPLNRVGGERRLNVAVTRAKCNVQLVSSMHYTDIDLKRTSAEGAKLLREYLDYAENGEIALERAVNVSAFEQFDSDFELEVCEFLRSKGFSVDTQVGCSGFRIDLGLKIPDSSDYVLAIECDGATYHSSKNARDRDRLRQEILERMGWKFYRIWSTDWFRNKSVEQLRLLEAATDAIKNPGIAETKPAVERSVETFEEVAVEKHFEFPPYKAADIDGLSNRYLPKDFKGWIRAILEVEAPLSEDLLLRRIVGYFGREKVTSVVQRTYEQLMLGCQRYGIIRRNGFLYLENKKEIRFRGPGDIERDIKQIAPEELADGMQQILKQNITAEKEGLFRLLALRCGVNRVGKAIYETLDATLLLLQDKITIDGDQISLK
ncbi:MAG: DUF4011 domain-containing protein [Oscillospiraceae bacterium]|nr:DUF4011 domain-containing protein [Oscillospiraceae bacterium]